MAYYVPSVWTSPPVLIGGVVVVGLVGWYAYSRYTGYNLGQTLATGIVGAGGLVVDTAKETAKQLYKEIDIGGGEDYGSIKWGENAANWAKATGGPVQKLLGVEGSAANTFPDLVASLLESTYIPTSGKGCKGGYKEVLGVCYIEEFGSTVGKAKTREVRERMHQEFEENLKKGINTNHVNVTIKDTTPQAKAVQEVKLTRAKYVDQETRKWMSANGAKAGYTPTPQEGWPAFHKKKGEDWDNMNGNKPVSPPMLTAPNLQPIKRPPGVGFGFLAGVNQHK